VLPGQRDRLRPLAAGDTVGCFDDCRHVWAGFR
jgi:hypothetical protein